MENRKLWLCWNSAAEKEEMFNGGVEGGTYVIPVPLFINIPWQMSRYDTTVMGEIFNHQVNTSTEIKQVI